ncbi:uncharacterized protein LOC130802597 [Amaranthus tricolor]|uniref:uncharacterized protein LOC130802597 n=1 Tax=Amaranthus tricolor TaxID=29722 RepID=UPI002583EC79|nr:uncharacterized protein LOC130802597 [Amaranthus tricolor]
MKVIENQAQKVHSMRVIAVNVMEFEVDDGDDSYIVNLEDKNCLCNKWRITRIPRRHALACIVKRKLDFAPYVHEAYYVSSYAKTCAPTFHGMLGHRNMPGRPTKNKRKLEFDEGSDGKKKKKSFVERDFKQNKCGNYGGLDHYKKTCKNPPKSNEASTSTTPVKR